MLSGFSIHTLQHGRLADLSDEPFPTRVGAWNGDVLQLDEQGTHFGFVHEGPIELKCDAGRFDLATGMYFSCVGGASVGGAGRGLVVSSLEKRGFFQLGGPVEQKGRLRYIDGCSDSLLISPVLRGDPCLNYLHIPSGTVQTSHTHPSIRVGLIVRGRGHCETSEGRHALEPGLVFLLAADYLHGFRTGDCELGIIAYHPDSDFGPTHEDHPMLNRTVIPQTARSSISDRIG